MSYTLKITPTAFSDIQTGIDYYQLQQKELSNRFAKQVEATFDKIAVHPHSASIAYAAVRYKRGNKFPYVILYIIEDPTVIILRVFNTYLNPTAGN